MKHLRRKPCQNLSPIYFLIDGRPRVYRCDCGAREFEIGEESKGQTELVCVYRKRHRVVSGFTVGEPDYERDTVWLTEKERKQLAHAVQLPLRFTSSLTIGQSLKKRSCWRTE